MPFDGIMTASLAKELNTALAGGRIRKIHQPETDEIRLIINKDKQNLTLLISVNPNNARVHLTQTTKANPMVPPSFCMNLRKNITGAEIAAVRQIDSDRVLVLELNSRNTFGEPCVKELICEITGRNSNLILVQLGAEQTKPVFDINTIAEDLAKDENRFASQIESSCMDAQADIVSGENDEAAPVILDALKKIGSAKSRFRQILPGRVYCAPPAEGRANAFTITQTEFTSLINAHPEDEAESFLTGRFLGVSPSAAREILARSETAGKLKALSTQKQAELYTCFTQLISHTPSTPSIYEKDGRLIDYYDRPLTHLGCPGNAYTSISAMLESFFALRDKRMHFRTKSANLRHQLESLQKKDAKKLQNLHKDYKRSLGNEKSKLYGDLITANIWQLEKGMTEAELPDYTKPEVPLIKVPLKINETPSQNAQRFYKKYNKDKRAQVELVKQISLTEKELYYIESLLAGLESSTELEELDEIRSEFAESGLIKIRGAKPKIPKSVSKPMHFISSEGFDIYVGKNNYQNDEITTKIGTDEDCWLHVKDAPGSHVLVVADGKFITEQTVLEAGMLAAWHSRYKNSDNVPVDYMEHKFVKKPVRAKPGMVIFTEHNTMYITPEKQVLESLKRVD